MAHLIDKDALVAEIERLREEEYPCDTFEESTGYYNALDEVSSFLNTLEMKEMDLEKELDSMITPELKFHKALPSLFDVAKHFFELGMAVSNKPQKGE